jgi:hypothetical protein
MTGTSGNFSHALNIQDITLPNKVIPQKFKADVAGVWVDLGSVLDDRFGVSGGALAGLASRFGVLFDVLGFWIDLPTYHNLVNTGNTAAMDALKIPYAQFGSATLEYHGAEVGGIKAAVNGITDLTMPMVFYGYSTNDVRLWTTQGVNGAFSSVPTPGGAPVFLSGDGLSSNFAVTSWDANRWAANLVNGGGTLNGKSLNFHGWARGSHPGVGVTSGTFSGKGVGPASAVPR